MNEEQQSSSLSQAASQTAAGITHGAAKGGVAGAVVGAGKVLLQKQNRKWLYILVLVLSLPSIAFWVIVYSVFSTSDNFSAMMQEQTSQAVEASHVSQAQFDVYETAADQYGVPWEILAAIAYYESGPGYGAGQEQGQCPPDRTVWTEAYCPSVTATGAGAIGVASCPSESATPLRWTRPGRYSWTVPAGVTFIVVSMTGGAGGGGSPGGSVKGCTSVYPGQKLSLIVGEAGARDRAGTGFVGGGLGGYGGGGSSAVLAGVRPLLETGGGGGAGQFASGGEGDYPNGGSGEDGVAIPGPHGTVLRAPGGEGGGQSPVACKAPLQAGAIVKQGSCDGQGAAYMGTIAGGGGGGYRIGMGGGVATYDGRLSVAGGGGGSSWAASSVTGIVWGHQQSPGNGMIQLSYQAGMGPYGITPSSGLAQGQAQSTAASTDLIARELSSALKGSLLLGKDDDIGFLSGEEASAVGVTIDPTSWSARMTMKIFVAALSKLEIADNSKTLDDNIFELATDWGLGQSPEGNGALLVDMVCGVEVGSTLTVADPIGEAVVLTAPQLANAAIIVHVGQQMSLPDNALQIALGTALTESGLWDLPNIKIPASETDPNAQWGGRSPTNNPPEDGLSVGLFQQQVGIWQNATVTEAMDPAWSASSFYTVLEGVPGWQSADTPAQMGLVAQAVQRSAYPYRYQGWMPAAATVLGAVLQIPCQGTMSATGVAATAIAAAEKWVGVAPYVWGGGGSDGPSGSAVAPPGYVGKPGFDCSGLVQYAFAQAGIVLPRFSGDQYEYVLEKGGFTTNISQLKPGYLVFFAGADGTMTDPGHVGIYIGNDEMVDAPETGRLVSIDPVTTDGFVGGGPAW